MSALSIGLAFLFLQIIVLIVSISIVFLMAAVVISMFLDVPFVATPRKIYPAIERALHVGPGSVVYELGCGSGHMLVEFALHTPEAQFIGVERNIILCLYARLNARMRGNPRNLSFRCENLFRSDLSGATSVYAYLLPAAMKALARTFHEREKPLLLVSRAFQCPDDTAVSIVQVNKRAGSHGQHLLYIYQFPVSATK